MARSDSLLFACLLAVGCLCAARPSEAVVYYVATTGDNSKSGSSGSPWLTIGYSASHSSAGDTVRVQPGTYSERVSVAAGGSVGSWKNFIADGQVICRGFDLTGVNYVRVIGFEITHTDTTYQRGITMANTCSHIDILDNYIHDIYGTGILAKTSSTTSYITVRGNTIYYVDHPGGTLSTLGGIGIGNNIITSDHWLVEYNIVARSGDFADLYGNHILVRNNYLHDYSDAYWTNSPDSYHSDMFQPGSDGVNAGTHDQVYERNFTGDSIELNSHFGIWQDTTASGDINILIRGNVAFNFGSGGIGVISTDNVSAYNNTFFEISQKAGSAGSAGSWYKRSTSSDNALGGLFANTIIQDAGGSADVIYVAADSELTQTHNLGYQAGTESSYVSTSDPLFIDPAARDFRLQGSPSPAIDAGTGLVTVTSADGSGTSFDVSSSLLLNDGWGMTDGDVITVGGTTTRITSISGSTVTVADSVTWTQDMPVYWGKDTTPDIGALPYGSTALTAATLARNGNSYTVTSKGDVRGVWFYMDGIPVIWVSSPPFTATITSGLATAKAYALYAQSNPVVSAAPEPPAHLHIAP